MEISQHLRVQEVKKTAVKLRLNRSFFMLIAGGQSTYTFLVEGMSKQQCIEVVVFIIKKMGITPGEINQKLMG